VRSSLILYCLALTWHLAWASTVPGPNDMDPAYYLDVARHLAAGDGAVTTAVWNLAWLPPALTHPADLHWMPLPSRWIAAWLWLPLPAWRSAQLATVLVAATWAPLAWATTRHLAPERTSVAWVAGILGALGGGYVRFLAVPDSIALYGALGGAALLGSVAWRGPLTAALAGLAALTRGEGALLSPIAALAGRRPWLASIGPLALLGWSIRNRLVAADGALALRERALTAEHWRDFARLGPVDWHPSFAAGAFPRILLVTTLGVLLPPLAAGVWRYRESPLVRAVVPGGLVVVTGLLLGAPALAEEGSVFRTGAAFFPLACALAALGAEHPRYNAVFLRSLLLGGALLAGVAAGLRYRDAAPGVVCPAIPAGEAVLSDTPVDLAGACGHPGIVRPVDHDPAALAARYGVRWATVPVAGWEDLGGGVWASDPEER
jgi:hypothetical protein